MGVDTRSGGRGAPQTKMTRSRPGLGPSGIPRRRYRTVFISDIHLGTRGCNADALLDFLDHIDCEHLYLVGDIIDGWRMKKRFYWPERHSAIIRRVMKRAKHGINVVYVPGNHDEDFRAFIGLDFGGVKIRRQAIHETADGRRLLVLHGDEFDAVVMAHRWLAFLGDAAYDALIQLNIVVNAVRRALRLPYWSLAKYAKRKVKNAVELISRFEEAVAHKALQLGVDGVVCGHIHTAEIRQIGDITYHNGGDWMESSTSLVEHLDGTMEILHWTDAMQSRERPLSEAA